MTQDAAVADFIHAYAGKLSAKDWAGVMADWEDDETLFYLAEEVEAPIIGRSAIERYWQGNGTGMHKLGVRIGDIATRIVAADLTSALFPMHWNAMIGGPGGQCLGGDVKAVALVRRTGDRLRLCQWTESALGPLPFLRRIYRQAVDPGFAD